MNAQPSRLPVSVATERRRSHIVISGTGRAGTTFLVELLSHLGLDTGFAPGRIAQAKNAIARAGLEHDIRQPDCPRVVKNPWFCDYAQEVFERHDLRVEHLFIPMRDIDAVAQSRRHVHDGHLATLSGWQRLRALLNPGRLAGGLVRTRSVAPGVQERLLEQQFYRLVMAATTANVPTTFLRFPRMVMDPIYLYDKLRPILDGLPFAAFEQVFARVANPALVHRFTPGDA